jgi:outer membrane receptor protein involved in Fe transport
MRQEACLWALLSLVLLGAASAQGSDSTPIVIRGVVQYEDFRRVSHARVQVKDQEGTVTAETATNDVGEFGVAVPAEGTVSVNAIHGTLRSEYKIVKVGREAMPPLTLTVAAVPEVSLEIISPLPPIPYRASSTTYDLSEREIKQLPRGENIELQDLVATLPSAAVGALRQIHLRQDHANLQFRIDGVPIPDTVTSVFSDVITPRAWQRADILLGGLPAEYGNRQAAVIDITSKSGTKPGFGSAQIFGGSFETVTPSFEYGGTVGEKFRYYALNSYTTTNRGIDPPTLGHSSFHNHNERNQTYLRGDYQLNNRNNFTWLFLNSVAKYQVPTTPGLSPNSDIVSLIQTNSDPAFNPVASEAVDEFQKENNQYGHMVWRHDFNASQFLYMAGYFRHTRADFKTDPLNVLAFTEETDEPFSAADQTRYAYSGGLRLDYGNKLNQSHFLKAGFQVDRTQAVNTTNLFAFAQTDPAAGDRTPTGAPINLSASNRTIGWREEFWVQDQYTPNDQWTINVGLRYDQTQYFYNEGQVSPRIGVAYKFDEANKFHVFYGRLFTPPNLERVPFAQLNTVGTTAEPENLTANKARAERSHYTEAGWSHAFSQQAVVQVIGYYKVNRYMSDAGQFGTTPLLNYFNFQRGWQRGIDTILKYQFTPDLLGRANVSWGQSKGYGLHSGHFLLEQGEIDDINSPGGVFADHMQLVTSSAVLTYRFREHTWLTGQMLYGSGLRAAEPGQKTNASHEDSYTIYNVSVAHIIPLGGKQKLLLALDVINLLDEQYFYNRGEQSIGLGVSHAGMPRAFFGRLQWYF